MLFLLNKTIINFIALFYQKHLHFFVKYHIMIWYKGVSISN